MAAPLSRSRSTVAGNLFQTAFTNTEKLSTNSKVDSAAQTVIQARLEDRSNPKKRPTEASAFTERAKKPCLSSLHPYTYAYIGNFEMAGHLLFWITDFRARTIIISNIFKIMDAKSISLIEKLSFVENLTNQQVRNEALEILFNLTLDPGAKDKNYLPKALRVAMHMPSEKKNDYINEIVISAYYNDEIEKLNIILNALPNYKISKSVQETIQLLAQQKSVEDIPDEYLKDFFLSHPKDVEWRM